MPYFVLLNLFLCSPDINFCFSSTSAGIDFKGVQMVINYDLPLTAVAYIHRIGTLFLLKNTSMF